VGLASKKFLSGGVTRAVPVALADGVYRVTLTSVDPFHAPGYQPDQTQEIWVLEALAADGSVVYVSPATSDIPDEIISVSTTVDHAANLVGVVALRARHVGSWPSPNSVMPRCALLTAVSTASEP